MILHYKRQQQISVFMIALMFLREDHEARSIVVSLALENDLLEVVPKGEFRRWREVVRVLDRADAGVLIIFNPYARVDKATLRDLKHMNEQDKPVFILYPDKFSGKLPDLPNIEKLSYRYGDISSITSLVRRIQELSQAGISKKGGSARKAGDPALWETILLILLGILAIYGIAYLLGSHRSKPRQ